uniref:Uncharacterized protein n=1 Tax=Panagrolaimus sp. JU765 TaxID=591449 RepID=A0AC34Q9V1_9BILA
MGWSLIQIIVAVLHIVVICATGMRTNEETRKVLNAVLAIVPDANADLDRFQINCFAHKMSTQYMWGMTVWRAFPLERTTFFTTRKVLNAVLAIVPDANADLDRFQINCFAHKMSTQYMWGMTVWRAFPLERTTFFTQEQRYDSEFTLEVGPDCHNHTDCSENFMCHYTALGRRCVKDINIRYPSVQQYYSSDDDMDENKIHELDLSFLNKYR